MRIKLILFATAIAVVALGAGISNAALQSSTSVKVSLKKAGAPAKADIVINNEDPTKVPEPVTGVVITSKVAKFNGKAIPACASTIPTNAAGNNDASEISPACPKGSKIGTGTFKVNTGTPGGPIPADFGTISGTVNVYNYKAGGGQQAAMLFEIMSDVPVPNAHQYSLATVSKSGVLTATVPKMEDLPPSVKNILSPPDAPRQVALANLVTHIKPPKSKKPYFTLKNTKNLDFTVTLQR